MKRKLLIFFLLCILDTLSYSAYGSTQTEDQVRFFDLPGQPLSLGLIEFASQADITITSQSSLLKGYRSRAIVGPLKISTAFNILLAKTPLTFRYLDNENIFLIEPKAISDSPLAIVPITKDSQIEEVIVTSSRYPFRYQTIVNTKLNNGISIFDSSRFHTVIPQALINDQAPNNLVDTLKYTSGITMAEGLLDSNDDFYVRGFPRNTVYIEGFRLSNTTSAKLIPDNIERVEILKGPSTLLFGQTGAGGVVNVLRKKPLTLPHSQLTTSGGSFGKKKLVLDVNSSRVIENTTNFRVIYIDDRQAESNTIQDRERKSFSGTARGKINNTVLFDIGYEKQYLNQDVNNDRPIYNTYGEALNTTTSSIIEQYSPEFSADIDLFSTSLTHYLTEEWHFSLNYLWQNEDRYGIRIAKDTMRLTDLLVDRNNSEGRIYVERFTDQMSIPILEMMSDDTPYYSYGTARSIYDQEEHEIAYSLNFSLEGSLTAFNRSHNISFGFDYFHQNTYQLFAINNQEIPNNDWLQEQQFNEYHANFLSLLARAKDQDGEIQLRELRVLRDDIGGYFQLTSEWTDRLSTSIGARYSKFLGEQLDITKQTPGLKGNIDDISIQVGSVFQPTENTSYFLNYNESLEIFYIVDDHSEYSKKPETAEQWELGLKSIFWNDRLISTVAIFDINKMNIYDIDFEDGQRKLNGPYHHSVKGLEADTTFQLSDSTQLTASLSYLNQQRETKNLTKTKPELVADNTFSLFLRQKLYQHWHITAGAYHVSDRSIGYTQNIKLGAYETYDIGIEYSIKSCQSKNSIKFLITNLLDEKFQATAISETRINNSMGRSIQIQLHTALDSLH